MSSRRIMCWLSGVALLGAATLAADSAHAEEWAIYGLPVGSCQIGLKGDGASSAIEWAWEGMKNADPNNPLYLDCSLPLPNDHILSQVSGYVNVEFWDYSPNADVVCNMKVTNGGQGMDITFTGEQKTSAGLPADWFLEWQPPTSWGVPYVSCSIPADNGSHRSGLVGMLAHYSKL